MVTKGLKKGDTFQDGGNTYKILEVLDNGNYISTMVKPETEVKTPKAAKATKATK